MEELTPEQKEQIEKIHSAKLDKISWLSIEVAILLLFAGTLLPMPKWLMMTVYSFTALSAFVSVIRRWSILLGNRFPVKLGFPKWFFLFQAVSAALAVLFRRYTAILAIVCIAFILIHLYLLWKEVKNEDKSKLG